MNTNRRNFMKTMAVGATALSLPGIMKAAETAVVKKIALKQDAVILFQGDSITDWGRKRENVGYNDQVGLGGGYPLFATAQLLCKYPQKNLRIYNRGISGNKVYELRDRWDEECIDLKPDVLSILVGVNDYWHKLSFGYKGTVETYEKDYTALLKYTKERLPDVQLIIGEPFAIKGVKAVDDKWFPEFDKFRAAAKRIASAFGAMFIPYQEIFDDACKLAPPAYWTGDGVHPSLAGAELMAEAWMKTISNK
ncbi:MAG: SGNH/GDSL hydrolase family protein [Bacteroidales bacterium]|nr:SGNH/GDSL hydrolase family protein [Bacteroidales bacterium]